MTSVAGKLSELGVADDRIFFFPSWEPDGSRFRSEVGAGWGPPVVSAGIRRSQTTRVSSTGCTFIKWPTWPTASGTRLWPQRRSVPPPCKQCDGEYFALFDRHLFCFFSACMIVALDGGDQQGGVLP